MVATLASRTTNSTHRTPTGIAIRLSLRSSPTDHPPRSTVTMYVMKR